MAHSIALDIQEEHGWTDATLLDVLFADIPNQASNDVLEDYLNERAESGES